MKTRLFSVLAFAAACSSRGGSFSTFADGGTDAPTVQDDAGDVDAGVSPDDAPASAEDRPVVADVGNAGCASDRECTPLNLVCDRVAGRCVDCVVDTDCIAGRICSSAQTCTPRACTPGESACVSTSRQSACDARGAGRVESACASGETCRSGRCQPAACAPGSASCDAASGQRRVCNAEGSGTTLVACPSGQRCSGGACVALACEPNSRVCVDGPSVQTCNGAGTATSMAVCPTRSNAVARCADGACGIECVAGFGNCDGSLTNGCETSLSSTTNCGACGRACAAGTACVGGSCAPVGGGGGDFRVTALRTTGCRTVSHELASGDDRGGIAVTADAVFYTGDTSTAQLTLDLASPTAIGVVHDAMFSDLGSGVAYALLGASGEELTGTTASTTTVTQLARLSASGALDASRIALSTPIRMYTGGSGTGSMIFSGRGQVVICAGTASGTGDANWYAVSLPDGAVRDLGLLPPPTHQICESWAAWGIAESVGSTVSVLYVEHSTSIARLTLGSGAITRMPFTDLGDMCSISFSPARNRWYFHFEGQSQFFTGSSEYLGYCDAAWSGGAP
jgi:hypothetical protein